MNIKLRNTLISVLFLAAFMCYAEEDPPSGWKLEAGSQKQVAKNVYEATGYVNFVSGDVQLQADSIRYDAETGNIVAEGNIVLTEKDGMKLTGDRIEMNIKTSTGVVYNATAFDDPSYFFTGDRIEKVGDKKYIIHKAFFTTCNQPKPYWSFQASRTTATLEKYARFRNLRMRVKDVPVLYLPYLIWPIKQDRTSGFLIPDVGYSDVKGSMFSTSFFWAISRNSDATFLFEYWEKEGVAFGTEFLYKLGQDGEGSFKSYYLYKNTDSSESFSADFKHRQKLAKGFALNIDGSYVNNISYYRSYENMFDLNSRSTVKSKAALTKNWTYETLNIIAKIEENYSTVTDSVELMSLPEIEMRGRRRKLFDSPLYLAYTSSAVNIRKEWSGFDYKYQRYDLSPELSLPFTPFPWLDIDPSAGYRGTYYSKTIDTATQELNGDAHFRKYFHGALRISGPKFYKTFNMEGHEGFFEKFKHTIEPVVNYNYSEDVEYGDYPLYDQVDRPQTGRNEVIVSLFNRLYGKPSLERFEPFELLSLEISQRYSFDSNLSRNSEGYTRKYSPVAMALRFSPLPKISGDLRVTYDNFNNEINSASVSGRFESEQGFRGDLIWNIYRDVYSGNTTGQQVRAFVGTVFMREKLNFDIELNYDIERDTMQNQRYRLSYKGQCTGFVLEYVKKKLGIYEDDEISFILELKDVGKLLDL